MQVSTEKTALLCFDGNLLKRPGGLEVRPESFTFLGFTRFLHKTREGQVNVSHTPSVKTRERFLRSIKTWLRANRYVRVWEQREHLAKALEGYYQYFGLSRCLELLSGVRQRVRRLWQQALSRRSQRAGRTWDWASLDARPWFTLPKARLTHTWV